MMVTMVTVRKKEGGDQRKRFLKAVEQKTTIIKIALDFDLPVTFSFPGDNCARQRTLLQCPSDIVGDS